jgi:hypothetical protein
LTASWRTGITPYFSGVGFRNAEFRLGEPHFDPRQRAIDGLPLVRIDEFSSIRPRAVCDKKAEAARDLRTGGLLLCFLSSTRT